MLAKTLGKIDRFYPILIAVLIALAYLVIFSLNNIFSALNTASGFDPKIAEEKTKVDKEKLDKAYRVFFERTVYKINFAQ